VRVASCVRSLDSCPRSGRGQALHGNSTSRHLCGLGVSARVRSFVFAVSGSFVVSSNGQAVCGAHPTADADSCALFYLRGGIHASDMEEGPSTDSAGFYSPASGRNRRRLALCRIPAERGTLPATISPESPDAFQRLWQPSPLASPKAKDAVHSPRIPISSSVQRRLDSRRRNQGQAVARQGIMGENADGLPLRMKPSVFIGVLPAILNQGRDAHATERLTASL